MNVEDLPADVRRLIESISRGSGHLDQLVGLGSALQAMGKTDMCVAIFKHVLEMGGNKPSVRAAVRRAWNSLVPDWHFSILNDGLRIEAFEAAIRRYVRPCSAVLEIGTGAGVLAMMAGRAGAKHVTTCECVPVIADSAREIIAANGLGDSIKVIAKKSTDLVLGEDLPTRADVLICDLFTSTLMEGEGLPALRHAHEHLLTQDAVMIPRAVAIRGCMAGGVGLEKRIRVGEVANFDLSHFNAFSPSVISLSPREFWNYGISVHSEPLEFFHFDFGTASKFREQRGEFTLEARRSGLVLGVLQWVWLQLDEDTIMEGSPDPDNPVRTWRRFIHSFPDPIEVRAGQIVRIFAEHDLTSFRLWPIR